MAISDTDHVIRCADCAVADSAVTDLRPSQRLEMPADALLGFPEHAAGAGGLTRRRLLRNGVIGLASIYAARLLDWESVWQAATAEGAEGMQKSIVVLYLNGGNDGLNTVVPIGSQYGTYADHRGLTGKAGVGRIGRLQPGGTGGVATFALGGTGTVADDQFLGLPTVMCSSANGGPTTAGTGDPTLGLDVMWGAGNGAAGADVALFPAADFSPDTQSHFDSRDIWFRGALENLQTGWIGRWLDQNGSKDNPLQAISLDSNLSKTIRTAGAPVAALDSLNGLRFAVPNVSDTDHNPTAQIAALSKVPVSDGNDALARSRGMFGLTTEVTNRLGSVVQGTPAPGYPNSYLSQRLQLAATLLSAGLGTRFITIDWGGFDTHGDQVQSQDPQLTVLSRALHAFQRDLANRGIEDKVITLVFSEFGRRVTSNSSDGTDHGAGGDVFVLGSSVRGGLAGRFPTLPTYKDGDQPNLEVVTDFRTVYSAIISEWLGTDPTAVLPKGPFPGVNGPFGQNRLLKAS